MTDHFDRMPAFVRERIHAEGWTSWRGVQEDSFDVLFDTDEHLLITAGTSSGKTEAAMLPVVTSLYNDRPAGVGALYVGPTKALIDDQFARLDRLLRDSPIPVTGWHGDIAKASKDRMREHPEGILQITPESLQGVVCDPELVRRMFPDLRFVVIDEVHSFMASDRGLQLLCELASIERIAGCSPRRIGLSATLSDTAAASDWLRAGTERRVSVVSSPGDTSGRIGVKHVRIPAGEDRKAAVLAYYKELHRLTDGYSCIVFTNSRGSAERTARSLEKVSKAEGSQGTVRIHHGSLSASLRHDAEADLKGGRRPTVVATSTLELGMDVGGLDRVVQIGAPYTCSSMLQRMGRTGRRGGRREMVIVCLDDDSKWSPSPPGVSMELIRAIAVADLAVRGGWTEPIRQDPLPFGLLYHQMLTYLKGAEHDVRWPELRDAMLAMWPFRNVSEEEARELARHMLSEGHLQRMGDGTLLIGLKAEPIVNGKDFASVFEVPAETEVRVGGESIGTVQGRPKEGALVSLAGKVWTVYRTGDGYVEVREAPADSVAESKWESRPPDVDDRVMSRMREVLLSDERFPWLDSAAKAELQASRSAFRDGGFDGYLETPAGYTIFPWVGTRRFEAMRRALADMDGVEVLAHASPYWIAVRTQRSQGQLEQGLRNIVRSSDEEDFVLQEDVEDMGKFERFVPEGLRAREFAADRLDFRFVE
ncbi:MAG: DEAD/DEAH box helicase [Thermoplasmata archaeon]|nr:DEAD/DEAH box helicase [Thermoplasmata archaeon]